MRGGGHSAYLLCDLDRKKITVDFLETIFSLDLVRPFSQVMHLPPWLFLLKFLSLAPLALPSISSKVDLVFWLIILRPFYLWPYLWLLSIKLLSKYLLNLYCMPALFGLLGIHELTKPVSVFFLDYIVVRVKRQYRVNIANKFYNMLEGLINLGEGGWVEQNKN